MIHNNENPLTHLVLAVLVSFLVIMAAIQTKNIKTQLSNPPAVKTTSESPNSPNL